MDELRIDVDLFKNEESAQKFIDSMRDVLEKAGGNMVPICNNGKLLSYAVAPDSPYWKNIT